MEHFPTTSRNDRNSPDRFREETRLRPAIMQMISHLDANYNRKSPPDFFEIVFRILQKEDPLPCPEEIDNIVESLIAERKYYPRVSDMIETLKSLRNDSERLQRTAELNELEQERREKHDIEVAELEDTPATDVPEAFRMGTLLKKMAETHAYGAQSPKRKGD